MPTSVKTSSRSNFRIIDLLNAEWEVLTAGSAPAVQRWRRAHAVFEGCDDVADVLQAIYREPDPAFGALLAADAEGDVLAGRVILQAMLGKAVRMAARDSQASVDDYVAALWLRIHTYPRQERPSRIAANLALDTLKSVTSETQWFRRGPKVTTVPAETLLDALDTRSSLQSRSDEALQSELSAMGVITCARQLGLLNDVSRDVLLAVYAEGLSGREAATRHETTPAMIRYRCSRAVRQMAQHAAELSDAA